ncbi:hypothetical protein PCANC_13945 [Puccinia coronata f. sp. avenae]|uniref:Ubiquitin-activating enzyme E1-like n=1 Tax=Puccinia coronata f. sp. avenae TaxID=200324 RepID=A0A2N5UGF9_9BASI|nr:hypothetical protein PCANC_13945 [Puccinia coronata f. sp. avenae]
MSPVGAASPTPWSTAKKWAHRPRTKVELPSSTSDQRDTHALTHPAMAHTSPVTPDQIPSPSRYAHLETLFGPRTRDRIKNSSLLVIGAGGIGCELLKNLVCTGFGHITIIDLDTVDTSNLNRQFLFQKKHVKRPKAIVARETASAFNPSVTIHALHANIMDPPFDQAYYKSFDLVLNALDNLAARRHVNKMCVITKVPLIESGTAGYNGQVQPIRSGKMECYDCQPKPFPKTFPVCTIRSTPSSPIHCIVWAKNYLFPQLFGPEDENEGADLDEAIQNGESVKEVETLKEEVKRMKEIRAQLDSPEMSKIVFKKLFEEDINRLLMMDDMWEHRKAPTPLNYDELASQKPEEKVQQNQQAPTTAGLKDQQTLSLKDSFDSFCSSLLALGKRIQLDASHEPLRWDKDDDEALDFVTAASNLRATIFGIPQKTRFDVKEMAGNIIPAIATTNSAVSALIVFQAINILSRSQDLKNSTQDSNGAKDEDNCGPLPKISACRPWYSKTAERIIVAGSIDAPNPYCEVCQVVYATVYVNPDCTLKDFITQVLKGKLYDGDDDDESITIQEGDRLLYDPDFSDNQSKSFRDLNLVDGQVERILRITDEAEKYVPLMFTISKTAPSTEEKILVEGLPDVIPNRPPPPPTSDPTSDLCNSDIEQITVSNGSSNGAKRTRVEPPTANADEIVVVDPANDAAHPPPAKKLKLDKPKEPFNPVEIVEIL